MKKTFKFAVAALAIFAAASCTKEIAPAEKAVKADGIPVEFTVSLEQNETKGFLDGMKVVWEEGDKVAVWDGTTSNEFSVVAVADGKAIISGTIAAEATDLVGVYPFASFTSADADKVTFSVPAVQTVSDKGIAKDALVSVARFKAGDATAQFKNVTTVLKFKADQAGIKSVNFSTNASIVGAATVAAADGAIACTGAKAIDIKPDGETFTNGAEYYFSIAGGVALAVDAGLIKTKVNLADGKAIRSSAGAKTFERNKVYNLGALVAGAEVIPFKIMNAAQLVSFIGNTNAYTADDTVELGADIDMTGVALAASSESWYGTFDGKGYFIKKFSTDRPLFGINIGTVQNVTFDESCTLTTINQTSGLNISFLIRENKGLVSSCINNGKCVLIDTGAAMNIGSLVGKQTTNATAKMLNCVNNGTLIADKAAFGGVNKFGALIGSLSSGTLVGCVNNGSISIEAASCSSNSFIGGILGYVDYKAEGAEIITNCVNNGTVKFFGSTALSSVGGIVGGSVGNKGDSKFVNYGKIKGCSNAGSVSFEPSAGSGYVNVGGIAGYWEGLIDGCFSTEAASVKIVNSGTGTRSTMTAGGIAARCVYSVSNCYNKGVVWSEGACCAGTASAAYVGGSEAPCVGGVIGVFGKVAADDTITMTNCQNYSSEIHAKLTMGASNNSASYIGGVVGSTSSKIIECTNSGSFTIANNQHKTQRIGGIVGNAINFIEKCNNTGNIFMKALTATEYASACSTNSANQCYVGGVIGLSNKGATSCTNSGKIALLTARLASYNYVGGIAGSISGLLKECGNTGDLAAEAEAKTRVGGIAGTATGGITDCTATGKINIENATSADGDNVPAAGGFAGHSGTAITGGSTAMQITIAANCGSRTFAGLVCGTVGNTNKTWDGVVVDGSIVSNGHPAGILLGGQLSLTSAANKVTVGGTSPIKVKATATINGAAVVAADLADVTKLVGEFTSEEYKANFVVSEGGLSME